MQIHENEVETTPRGQRDTLATGRGGQDPKTIEAKHAGVRLTGTLVRVGEKDLVHDGLELVVAPIVAVAQPNRVPASDAANVNVFLDRLQAGADSRGR